MDRKPDCNEMFEQISEYIDGELAPEARANFEAHCRNCEPCKNFIATYRATVQLAREIGPPEGPSNFFSSRDIEEFRKLFQSQCE